jgi:hypothetical protein
LAVIILCVVAALVFLAVKVFRLCVAAIVAVRVLRDRRSATRRRASVSVATVAGPGPVGSVSAPGHLPDDAQAPSAGPQDAPLDGPWPLVAGPQDARGYPQDAPLRSLGEPRPEPLPSMDVTPPTVRRAVAQLAAAVVARQQRATLAVTELPDGRLVLSLTVGREARPEAAAGELDEEESAPTGATILDLVPRPTSGPAYLGGRDDDAYLRGWDDGVDWVRQGNPERGPSWSSAAYMTGWNDSLRAVAKVRCA